MEIMVQLYNAKLAKRTNPVATERNTFAQKLRELPTIEDAIVIVLMEKLPGSDEWQFAQAPLYNVVDFIKFFGEQDNG